MVSDAAEALDGVAVSSCPSSGSCPFISFTPRKYMGLVSLTIPRTLALSALGSGKWNCMCVGVDVCAHVYTSTHMSVFYVEGRGQSWDVILQAPSTFNFFFL